MVSLRGERVYLDTNTIIYALEGTADYPNLKTGLLESLDRGECVGIASELSLVEALVGPRRSGDLRAEKQYRGFFKSTALTVAPITRDIPEEVIDLRAKFSMKMPDAIHIATGLRTGCSVFLTGDLAWRGYGVNVIDPKNVV